MKYLFLITAILFSTVLLSQNSDRGGRSEKIEQQKIAYITTELDLSVEESQLFWPIYNDYQKAKKESNPNRKKMRNIEELTEGESLEMLSIILNAKRKETDLEITFMSNLENILPAKKRLKLIQLDREFKKKILKRYQKRMKRGEKHYEKGN